MVTVLLLAVVAASPAISKASAAEKPAAAFGGEPELSTALAELDVAGTPPTINELKDIKAGAGVWVGHGELSLRTGGTPGAFAHRARGRLDLGWLQARLRRRRDAAGRIWTGGALAMRKGQFRAGIGGWGVRQGFGLLVGPPGRGPVLAADGPLGIRSREVSPWAGWADGHAVRGAVVGIGAGSIRGEVIAGRRDGSVPAAASTVIARLAHREAGWGLSGLFVTTGAHRGLSLAGESRRRAVDLTWETTIRQPRAGGGALGALLVQAGWHHGRRIRCEALAGWADPGPRPALGFKHPVLGDWGGRGWALRVHWRPAAGLGLKLLLNGSLGAPEAVEVPRRQRVLGDLQVRRSWPGGWEASGRWRHNARRDRSWSARFPWLASVESAWWERDVVTVGLLQRHTWGRWRLRWRRLQQAETVAGTLPAVGARALLGADLVWQPGPEWRLRSAWTIAWGDPVDLVGALVPFDGFVLPRHWGRWAAEQALGVAWGRRVQVRAAVVRRVPDVAGDAPSSSTWQAWCEGGWRW